MPFTDDVHPMHYSQLTKPCGQLCTWSWVRTASAELVPPRSRPLLALFPCTASAVVHRDCCCLGEGGKIAPATSCTGPAVTSLQPWALQLAMSWDSCRRARARFQRSPGPGGGPAATVRRECGLRRRVVMPRRTRARRCRRRLQPWAAARDYASSRPPMTDCDCVPRCQMSAPPPADTCRIPTL